MFKNMKDMMKQAKVMQEKMEDLKRQIADEELTAESGGGMIKVVMTGGGVMKKLSIDSSLFKAEDKAIVEDLVIAAINEAKSKAEAFNAEKMSEITGGMGLPGDFKLPF